MLRNRADHHHSFWNTSRYDLSNLAGDVENLRPNLENYIEGFSPNIRTIFEHFKMHEQIAELHRHDLLLQVIQHFAKADLSPANVSNETMGHIFEELIRKFAEASNETAGEHFTPRDVIELMVSVLLDGDEDAHNQTPGLLRSVYDPTAGTGGMLSIAEEHLQKLNPAGTVSLYGQEINPQSWAVCNADMIFKGQDVNQIHLGDTLVEDGFPGRTFHYGLSNPPFGVDWKKTKDRIQAEHEDKGWYGRFGAGLPRVSDGSLLFLQHLLAKLHTPTTSAAASAGASPSEGGASTSPAQSSATAQRGGRAGIVLNGSPLFTGGAGSGESEIRRWVLEQDWLECIIALPSDMFYNTGIATYVWVLNKQKPQARRGKVQLLNATSLFVKMRKSIGSKRNEISKDQRNQILAEYTAFAESPISKIFRTEDFLYRTITVERPLRQNFAVDAVRVKRTLGGASFAKMPDDDRAELRAALEALGAEHPGEVWMSRAAFQQELEPALKKAGVLLKAPALKKLYEGLAEADETAETVMVGKKPAADTSLRDTENVPWNEDVQEYVEREVLPFVPDAWIDESKTKIGCEIPFTRHFYEYVPPRPLEEIDRDLDEVLGRIRARLEQVKA